MARRSLPVVLATSAQRMVSDPGSLVVSGVFYVVVVSVLSSVWRVAARANGNDLAGYSALALTWYIASSEGALLALNQRMIDDIGRDIGTAGIAVELLRPISVLAVRIATEVGRAIPRLAVVLPCGAVLALVVAGPPPSIPALMLSLPSFALAVACNIAAQHAFAGIAFWQRNAGSTWFLYQKLVFVLGGMLIPLEVLPTSVRHVAAALPFQAMAYAPARIASGHFEPHLLANQALWLAVLLAAAAAVLTAGERRLQVLGG